MRILSNQCHPDKQVVSIMNLVSMVSTVILASMVSMVCMYGDLPWYKSCDSKNAHENLQEFMSRHSRNPLRARPAPGRWPRPKQSPDGCLHVLVISRSPWTVDSCFGWWRFRGLLKPCFLVTWQLVETNSKPIWDERAHTNISDDRENHHHITRLIILSNRSNLIDHANL